MLIKKNATCFLKARRNLRHQSSGKFPGDLAAKISLAIANQRGASCPVASTADCRRRMIPPMPLRLKRPRTSPGRYSAQTGLWMRFGNVNQTSLLPLLSTFTIFDCIEDRMRLGHAKSSRLLLHGSRLSLSLARRRLAAPNHLRLSHARDGSLAWTSARTGFGRVPDSKPLLPCTRIPPPSSRTQPRFAAPRKQGKDCKT